MALSIIAKEQNGVELLMEPTAFQPAKTYQKELIDADTCCNNIELVQML